MGINPKQTEITRKYTKKHPDMSTLGLSRLLFNDWPELYASVENARSVVRGHRGNSGESKRSKFKDKSNFRTNGKAGEIVKMPKSKYVEWKPFEINHRKNLILSDPHIPYHSDKALEGALKHGDDYKPDAIILNGDVADCFSVSWWVKNPKLRDFPGEIIANKHFLDSLRSRFPKAKIYYKMGNHEERYERFLWQRCEELLGVPEFEFKNLLKFDDNDITAIEDQRVINLGQLPIVHGHEFSRGLFSSVNAARGLFLKAKHSCLVAHHHQTSEHTARTISDKMVSCWSVGCLCGLSPEFLRLNNWNHGFATVDVKPSGEYHVSNYRILDGKVLN